MSKVAVCRFCSGFSELLKCEKCALEVFKMLRIYLDELRLLVISGTEGYCSISSISKEIEQFKEKIATQKAKFYKISMPNDPGRVECDKMEGEILKIWRMYELRSLPHVPVNCY